MRDYHRWCLEGQQLATSINAGAVATPNDLPLPRLLNARHHLLDAMCLIDKGIQPHCFQVLHLDRNFERRQYCMLKLVVFSFTGLEERLKDARGWAAAWSDQRQGCDGTLDGQLETDFGSHFFCSTDQRRSFKRMTAWSTRQFLMRQHCRDVYQPRKKFMTRHMQHVRYMRPPRLLSFWINDRLAPGAYPFDESAIDLTRLRIAY
ncbi:hypothetical protein PHYPSEUDO_008074 [Phytophthora pseudosyringae]|uniref:Uncharacterized protein n=1 Tax=Phytophthora pseudosyringae TaxID=221518 RepID=A0A8T1VFY7_9STRA|nr:hypothetical protein PHYPSEUDO_008074 [Phytophthora pseudosyringae]